MKKHLLKNLLIIIIVAIEGACFASCGDDDDGTSVGSNSDLVGYWVKETHINNPVRNGSSGIVTSYGYQFISDNEVYVFQLHHTGLGTRYAYAEANTSWEKLLERNGVSFYINPDKQKRSYTRVGNDVYIDISSNPTILSITDSNHMEAISIDGWAEGIYVKVGTETVGNFDGNNGTNTGDDSGSGNNTNSYEANTSGKLDGHDYVDLGLSVKWATCNIGASSSESYGSYFAWGETSEKTFYNYSNYAFYKSTNYGFKYTYVSGGNISGTRYDAAYSKWGGSWRMPTKAEYDEIENKCTSKWITYKGVKGRLFTAPNGNSIFFPAAGEKDNYETNDLAECGNYWTSTIANHSDHSDDYPWAYSFSFSSNDQVGSGDAGWYGYRSKGMSVRAVSRQ